MMKKRKVKALADGAISAALAVLLIAIGTVLPPLSLFMTVAAGAPMMYLGVRHGTRISAVAAIAAVLLLFILTGNLLSAVLAGIMSLLPGIAIGTALAERTSFSGTIFAGAGVMLFGLLLQLLLINASDGGHGIEAMIDLSLKSVEQGVQEALSVVNETEITQFENFQNTFHAAIEQVRALFFLYLPAFLVGTSVLLSYLMLMLGIFLLHRMRAVRILYRPFWAMTAPRSMGYVVAVLFFVTGFSNDSTVWTAALRNILLLLYAYFAVCGLSFVDYRLKAKLPSGYGRAMLYMVAVLIGYPLLGFLFQGLSILGMLDSMFGFRHWVKVGEDHGGRK